MSRLPIMKRLVIFPYNETETYHVTASIHQRNESEALSIVLKSTPFIYKERENYFVISEREH